MTKRTKIKEVLHAVTAIDDVLVKGWIRTRRTSKDFSFLEVNDGSSLKSIQVIADSSVNNYGDINRLTTGSSVAVSGSRHGMA